MPRATRSLPLLILLASCHKDEGKPLPSIWTLELNLASASTVAGEPLTYEVVAVSNKGETQHLASWILDSAQEPGLHWDPDAIMPTKATGQTILADAEVDGQQLHAEADVTVKPGPTTDIKLTLDMRDSTIEVGDSVQAHVETHDTWDNDTDAPYTVTVEGGTSEVVDNTITFLSDGEYTVTATAEGTKLTDSKGPFVVDSSGPEIALLFPTRADTTTNGLSRVRGTITDTVSDILSATMDSEPLTLEDDGAFTEMAMWDYGLNVVTFEATDGDGNSTDKVHAVLRGEFLGDGETVPEGVVVHLSDGDGGLDEIVGKLDSSVEAIDISSSLPINFTGGNYDLSITGVSYGFGGIEVTPDTDVLWVETSLSDLQVDIDGQLKYVLWIDASGAVTADDVKVKVALEPGVTSSGKLKLDIVDTKVNIDNLQMDFESSLFSIIDLLGIDTILENKVTDMLEDQIAAQIEYLVQTQVQSALEGLVLDQPMTVLGTTFDITGTFSRVTVDPDGITVAMDVDLTSETELPDLGMPGSLYAAYEPPDLSDCSGIQAGLGVDMLNRVLYIAWQLGALNQVMTSEQLGLSAETLQWIFPGTTSVTFTTEALMPPVVLPGDMFTPLHAQLGSLRFVATDQDGLTLLDIYVSTLMDVDVTADGTSLTPSIALNGDPWIDVETVTEASTGIVNYDALLELMLPQIVDSLASALQAVPIPQMEGAALTVDRVALYGEGGGYVAAIGTLDLE